MIKKIKLPFLLLLSGLLLTIILGCSSSSTISQDEDKEINPHNTWTLKDHLRRKLVYALPDREGMSGLLFMEKLRQQGLQVNLYL